MVEITDRESAEKGFQVLRIIWAGILGSLFTYVLVCHLWIADIRPAASPDLPLDLIRNILLGIAIFSLILTRFIRKRILAGRSDSPGPVPLKSPSDSDQSELVGKYALATIISLSLSEFIGIVGLVLFFLGDHFQVLYTFIAISAVAMFFYRPRREELETLAMVR